MTDVNSTQGKCTLFFRQTNIMEAKNKHWPPSDYDKPDAFVSLEINAATLPKALRIAWGQLAMQDISKIAHISFNGALLKTDYDNPKRNLENMCYNAHMGILPAKSRLRSLNNNFRQYLVPPINDITMEWMITNYGYDLAHRFAQKQPEALDEFYGLEKTMRFMEQGRNLIHYDIPGYIKALKEIRLEMSGYERQIEMAEKMYKNFFSGDMPEVRDIFIKEYFYDITLETPDPEIKETLEYWLETDSVKNMWEAVDAGGSLPGGKYICEYIPVAAWDINERYFLIDYNGDCFSNEKKSAVECCVNDALEGNPVGLNALIAEYKKDMRPFAEYLSTLFENHQYSEANTIAMNLSDRGIVNDFLSKATIDALREWASRNKTNNDIGSSDKHSVLEEIKQDRQKTRTNETKVSSARKKSTPDL